MVRTVGAEHSFPVRAQMGVKQVGAVDISVSDELLAHPVDEARAYDLDALVNEITEENRHGEIPGGRSVGNEFLRAPLGT